MTLNYSDLKRNINIPAKETNQLAEFFGILTGDGYIGIYNHNYIIEIAGNKIKDKDYLENHVFNLFYSLFNIKPNINFRNNQNTMYLKVQSKAILEYLKTKGFKEGLKGRINIPKWINENDEYLQYFIKGLFDTDGCVIIKRKEGKFYPCISIGSKSDWLLNNVKFYLDKLNISSYFATIRYKKGRYKTSFNVYQLQINGYNNIIYWFQKIGSNNLRNLDRFNEIINLREAKRL